MVFFDDIKMMIVQLESIVNDYETPLLISIIWYIITIGM